MENQLKLNQERLELLDKLKASIPDLAAREYALLDAVYRDGALSHRVKRLMALVAAMTKGCVNCTLAQTTHALDQGASTEEILETISVSIAMNGTTGIAESLRVVKMLEEMGKI